MNLHFKYSSSPVSDADIDAVEKRFGFRFPEDIRATYLLSNGGRPDRDKFVYEGDTYTVDTLLSIKTSPRTMSTLELSNKRLKVDRHLLPDSLVPFAIDPFGDYFCFSVDADDYGAIHIFRVSRFGEAHYSGTRLARSFAAFALALVADS